MVAGMNDITGRAPDEVPAHWLAYFAVEDTDATIAKANDGGGEAVFRPDRDRVRSAPSRSSKTPTARSSR